MQTLISVFDDRGAARKAVDRLVRAGFAHDDVHLHEAPDMRARADDDGVQELADHTMRTAEREVAVDRGVLESLGHFFVSLFGEDRGERATGTYAGHVQRGHSVVLVDARTDDDAEAAAVVLHDSGAIEVDDREGSADPHSPGVHLYQRETPSLRELARQRMLRGESLLANRAGQVSREMKEDREERAYASAMNHTDRDRPK